MAALEFTLSPSAAALLHGVLLCLSRFNDTVSFDAREENVSSLFFSGTWHCLTLSSKLTLNALNLSNTAHAAVKLGRGFFLDYSFNLTESGITENLSFSVAIKVSMY